MNKKQKKTLIRILISAALLILFSLLPVQNRWLRLGLFLIPYFIIGYDILLKAFKGVKNRQPFDECFLMTVATVGAFVLGEFVEGAAVMLFYQIGELFQSVAVGKSRRSITELMDIRPDVAYVLRDGGEAEAVDPDEVEIGTVLCVRPGEKIPIDGIVVKGETTLDTAALTGESVPRTARPGDEVLSGCINQSGYIELRTTKEFGDSTASRVLDLVENASSRKSRSEAFITRFARVYTPAVCLAALALAVLPPLFLTLTGQNADWGGWVYRALTFLVISCPCALVISIPLTFFAGIGTASRQGVLVKGSNYLEALSDVRTVAFDKTGTVTLGVFEVAGVHHSPLDDRELLRLAARAERKSTHPIARSIIAACGDEAPAAEEGDIREVPGQGIEAELDNSLVLVGNEKLMKAHGVSFIPCGSVGTVVHIARDGEYLGHILIADRVKPGAKAAIESLKKAGVRRTVMLTGDRREAAEAIARELSIDQVEAELLPDQKVEQVEKLLAAQSGKDKLAFVGDGINDAPVLSRADVGIAMGALGSDAAIEAADVVLMDDDPGKIALAVRIARACLRIVRENIWFAIGVKALCLLLGALGVANMWMAIFADVGVMVLAVLNAVRILLVRKW